MRSSRWTPEYMRHSHCRRGEQWARRPRVVGYFNLVRRRNRGSEHDQLGCSCVWTPWSGGRRTRQNFPRR